MVNVLQGATGSSKVLAALVGTLVGQDLAGLQLDSSAVQGTALLGAAYMVGDALKSCFCPDAKGPESAASEGEAPGDPGWAARGERG